MAWEGYHLGGYRLSPIDILDLLGAITECVGGGKHPVLKFDYILILVHPYNHSNQIFLLPYLPETSIKVGETYWITLQNYPKVVKHTLIYVKIPLKVDISMVFPVYSSI